jgi:hypothetical protein
MRLFVLVSLAVLIPGIRAASGASPVETQPAPSQQASLPLTPQLTQPTQPTQPSPQPSAQQTPQPSSPQRNSAPAPAKSKIVYVRDFELDAVDAEGKLQKSVPPIPPSTSGLADPNRVQTPVERAGRLVDFMATTLVKELETAGYNARRLRLEDTRPTDGIQINGIFGEPDEFNRLRRAIVGTISVDGKMSLYVGIGNLAKPDQAFYTPANPESGNKAGAVITVTSYGPVAKFEMEKNTTETAVKNTASGIVADLGALLSANEAALTD